MRKKIQLLRNENVYIPSEGKTALDNAKTDLSNVVLNDGEIVIGRYQENNENVKTVLGIKHNIEADGQENPVEGMTFFTNSDNFVSKPVVLYQTDGTTGLLGVNPSQLGNDWQLENYDFSPYKYLRCYFKMGNFSTNGVELTPSMVVELPLDIESKSKSAGDSTQEEPKTACDMYIAGGMSPNPSDPSNAFSVLVAVDSTKTKFQVINQMMYDEYRYDNTYGNSETPANNNGRFLYKIEGCYDTLNNASTSELVEHDPVFTASPAYGITSADIDNWNSKAGGSGITGIKMNEQTVGTSGIVDLGTVLTSHQDISGKADKSAAIGSLSLALDSTNYKITLSGTKVDGTSFTVSNVIDLPLESVVVNGSYDNTAKKVVLTLQNGSTIDFSVADLVAGLQSEITSTNKLSADLISDGNTNKTVTATEKSTWDGKQDALSNANVLSGITSTKVSNWDSAATNSHTHSNKSVLDGIKATDITNWNGKTSNVGTITGITMNGSSKGISGVVDLGTVLTSHQDISGKANTADLATVATSGSYNDLSDKPTIPAAQVQSDWNATTGMGVILNKPTIPSAPGTLKTNNTTAQTASASESLSGTINLHKVAKTGTYSDLIGTPTIPSAPGTLTTTATAAQSTATNESLSGNIALHKVSKTGSYNDLNNKPTIPTVNNATITIKNGSTTLGTFTVNASSNVEIDISSALPIGVPTYTSADNGKILGVVNGALAWITPTTIYTGSGTPSSSTGNDGDIYLQTS